MNIDIKMYWDSTWERELRHKIQIYVGVFSLANQENADDDSDQLSEISALETEQSTWQATENRDAKEQLFSPEYNNPGRLKLTNDKMQFIKAAFLHSQHVYLNCDKSRLCRIVLSFS